MRTTVTLDPDTEAGLRRVMSERGVSFKQALNDAIRRGTESPMSGEARTRVRDLGVPKTDLDKALQLAGALEDEEIIRQMAVGR